MDDKGLGSGTLRTTSRRSGHLLLLGLCAILAASAVLTSNFYFSASPTVHRVPVHAQEILAKCAALRQPAGPPTDFGDREVSDRFEPGTNATLIRNARIWTGINNGTDIVYGDVLLDQGIVKAVGKVPRSLYAPLENITVVDAKGAWVTPGLVDLHSHVGLLPLPSMRATFDVNSPNGPILPWLRSIDGFNTHDEAFRLGIAGGVTSVQALPGSGNAIGGQAFMMKLRKTSERSPSSMVLEPPHSLNGSELDHALPPRWRHMKQACGENIKWYGTRMDSIWAFRWAYNEAQKVKTAQDSFCSNAEQGLWDSIHGQEFPDDYKWEMLVDVLRGRVKISHHCYEAVDFDDIVRLTNEFQFPIALFHHASEAYLVPDVLKRAWGGTPAIAIFATNHRYKRESYRGSEFAPRILADNDIRVVMKTDHPVINTRYLLNEAQQAHYYGLPPHLALASVASTAATAVGMAHRIGFLRVGADADVVLWDSHPLQLGATPVQVWIDGIKQLPEDVQVGVGKDDIAWKRVPSVPDWTKERKETWKWEGLPPLEGRKEEGVVVFTNVKTVWSKDEEGELTEAFAAAGEKELGVVVAQGGKITCAGSALTCSESTKSSGPREVVDLQGGSIAPGLMTYGSPLGIEEIASEPSTGNGALYDPFFVDVPKILGDTAGITRAADALQFGTRNALLAYRSGVTVATSSLTKVGLFVGPNSIISGLSTTFRTGAAHALEDGAVVKEITALHVNIGRPHPVGGRHGLGPGVSVSTEIAALRRLLLEGESKDTETGRWFRGAAEGTIPLVIEVSSADIMASLLKLKTDIEEARGTTMRMVFSRASEAHLLAKEIAKARVGVILIPPRPFPDTWDDRRILPGPPLTNDTALVELVESGVTVAIGAQDGWQAGNTRWDLTWAALESNGRINQQQAYALASTNLEKLLDVRVPRDRVDLVAYSGGSALSMSSKVAAILSSERGAVEFV
ncbi:composite domain of metallo-dependent hydrolase [Heliocybe sulcata]|uniref:Composite domain of metallo-dependent hydrolase n=1 Tax=Heliocybe sulcata TaxID=5364 RepID=A0A5C3NCG4_9AGAM|nr:composite domain of metallo-dependent hydrolase [Heliocybe sulcata]